MQLTNGILDTTIANSVEWLVNTALHVHRDVDIVIGRVSEWDHHGYYRLLIQQAADHNHHLDVYEITLFHEHHRPDIRGFNSSHALMFTRMSITNGCTKHVISFICLKISLALSPSQLVSLVPSFMVHKLNRNYNALGQEKWTILDLQPLCLSEFDGAPQWMHDFEQFYHCLRAKFQYFSLSGLCFDLTLTKLPMKYIRLCIVPQSVDVVSDSYLWQDSISVEMEMIGSYYPQEEWKEQIVKNRQAFCIQKAFFNEHGDNNVNNVMEYIETFNVWKWMFYHFVYKIMSIHVENLLFKDPMKYLYVAFDCLKNLPDVPKIQCGNSVMDWCCQAPKDERTLKAASTSLLENMFFETLN